MENEFNFLNQDFAHMVSLKDGIQKELDELREYKKTFQTFNQSLNQSFNDSTQKELNELREYKQKNSQQNFDVKTLTIQRDSILEQSSVKEKQLQSLEKNTRLH